MLIELDNETVKDIKYAKSYPSDDSSWMHLGQDLMRLYLSQKGE